ncbi:MAG: hypothetical protein WCI27_06660 [Candidatus Omnitrophota bacterium]
MKNSCSLCSSRGRADCPALGASICGPCCGSKRNSAIKCAADCRFNPFSLANYDGWLRIDSALSRKMMEYRSHYYDEGQFEKIIREMMYEEGAQHALDVGAAAAMYYVFFTKPFKNGKTVAALWREEGWAGLNSDEIAMMECRFGSGPALVEIQKILDHQAMECLDLLKPERGIFLMLDRSLASSLVRFSRIWMWIADYPHFSRPAGGLLGVPEGIEGVLQDKISMDVQKGRDGVSRNELIARNFGKYGRFICSESSRRHQRMLNAMDVHVCKAFYEIKGKREDVKKVLDAKPDFRLVEAVGKSEAPWPAVEYDWFRQGESKVIEKKMLSSFHHDEGDEMIGILGRVFLGEKEMLVQTMSKLKSGFAKEMVERYWGDSLALSRESVVDLAKQMAQRAREKSLGDDENDGDAVKKNTAIPREIEEKMITEHYRKHYERFLNDPIPALDGMTPRKAAKSAKMRARLIELMKGHIHGIDGINKDRGFSVSLDWVLDELGLKELQ